MRKKFIYLMVAAVLLLPLAPEFVKAASYNTVTTSDTSASIYLSDLDKYYTISTISVDTFTVNTGSIELSVLNGSSVKLTSTDKSKFSVSATGNCNLSSTCESSQSTVTVSCNGTETVTITPSATACSESTAQSSGSTGSSGAPSGYTVTDSTTPATTPVVVAPVVTTPAVVTPVVTAPVATTAESVSAPSVAVPESKVVINNINAGSFQPGTALTFTYQYQNEGAASQKINILRTIENSKGKVIKKATGNRILKPGSTVVVNVSDTLAKTLPAGDYTVKVKILNSANKVLEENNFPIVVEKLKSKYFVLGSVASTNSAITFDEAVLAKVVSNKVLPANFKAKYSYVNNTETNQSIKMVRELLNASGKIVATYKGNWTMKPGEVDSLTFTQAVAGNLSAGEYTVRIRALDRKTGEVYAENSLGFTIELR